MERMTIGRLGAPFGVRGHLRLKSYSGEYAHIAALRELTLRGEGGVERTVRVAELKNAPGGAAIRFEGIDSPEAARPFVNLELVVERAKAAPLSRDEWYVDDLVGCALYYKGAHAGEVIAVVEGAADPLLETKTPEGPTFLIPFRKEFVGAVDIASRRIELLASWIME